MSKEPEKSKTVHECLVCRSEGSITHSTVEEVPGTPAPTIDVADTPSYDDSSDGDLEGNHCKEAHKASDHSLVVSYVIMRSRGSVVVIGLSQREETYVLFVAGILR